MSTYDAVINALEELRLSSDISPGIQNLINANIILFTTMKESENFNYIVPPKTVSIDKASSYYASPRTLPTRRSSRLASETSNKNEIIEKPVMRRSSRLAAKTSKLYL